MLSAENLAGIESEGRRLGQAARRDPDRPVPQYPGWALVDLAHHTAAIHARTVLICEQRPSGRISKPTLPTGKDPIDWYDESLEAMLAALTDADPDAGCWAFGNNPVLASWETRMVVETGVHRWDASQALGEEDPLTDLVARSGLEEFADMWLRHLDDVQTLRVSATDLGESWTYGEGDPTASVEGTASDVYLRLLSRPSSVGLPDDWSRAVDGLEAPPKQ